MDEKSDHTPLLRSSFMGLCPECGAQSLFSGWVEFAPHCPKCGLDYSKYNVGDGPAAFLTTVIGGLLCILAIFVHLKYAPPLWVHLLLWLPLTILAVIYGLRISKAMLITAEHRLKGKEAGRNSLVEKSGQAKGAEQKGHAEQASNSLPDKPMAISAKDDAHQK